MSTAIKVGSGYVEVVPRLQAKALEDLRRRLNRQMALAGGNAGRAMSASLTTTLQKSMDAQLKKMGRQMNAQARTAGSSSGELFIRNFNRATKGKMVFADASTLRASTKQAGNAGSQAGTAFSQGLTGNAMKGVTETAKELGKAAQEARKAFEGQTSAVFTRARQAAREAQNATNLANVSVRNSRRLLDEFVNIETRFADQTQKVFNRASTVAKETANVQAAANRSLTQSVALVNEYERAFSRTEEHISRNIRSLVGLGNVSNQQIRSISESVRSFSNRMQGFGQDWSLFITAPILGSMAMVSAWGLQVGAELQKAQIGIQRLAETAGMGLAEATALANAQLANLRAFAEDSTFEFAPLANGVQRLMAAGVEAEEATRWIKTLGDTTAAYGAGADEMNRAVIAISQSMAAGKIYAQDMNQLNNAGIPVWRMMAEATGQTEAELRALGREGELLSDDIWPQLIDYMEQYNGTAQEMAQTVPLYAWQNALERFRNSLGDLINGTDETMEIVNPERPAMWVELFEKIEETLTRIVPIVGQALDWIVPALTRGFDALNGFLAGVTNSEGEISNFGIALAGLAAFLGPLMVAIGFIGRGIASLISGLRLLPDNIQSLVETVENLQAVGDTADDMGDSVDRSGEKVFSFKERLQLANDYLTGAAETGWTRGTDLADRWGAGIVRAADKIGEFGDRLRTLPNAVGDALLRAEDHIGLFAINSLNRIETVSDGIVRGFNRGVESTKRFYDFVRDGSAWEVVKANLSDFESIAKVRFNNALASFDNFFQGADGGLNRIINKVKSIPSVVRIRYEEAGGIRGIAQSAAQGAANAAGAVGRGAAATARGAMGAIGALITLLDAVLGPAMEVMQDVLGGTLRALGDALAPLAQAFAGALLPALTVAVLALTPAILAFTPVMEMLGETLGPVIEVLATEFASLMEQLAPVFSDLITNLSPFLSELGTFVGEFLGALGPVLGELLVALSPVIAMIGGAFIEVLNILLPIVVQILEAITPLVPVIGEFLTGAIEFLTPIIQQLFDAISPLVPVLGELLMSALEIIVPIIMQLFEALSPIIDVFVVLLTAIMPIIEALMPLIELIGLLLGLVVSILAPIIELAATIIAWLIEKALVPLIGWIADAVTWVAEKLGPKVEWLSEKLIDFTEVVVDKFQDFRDSWDEIWDAIGEKAQEIYDDWIKPVIDGVGEAWDRVSGLFSGDPDEAPDRRAEGGVIPGYAPGIDSVPALLSPGEGILRPEVVRWLGKSTIDRWNAGAMSGLIPRFATGGIVGDRKSAQNGASAVLGGPVLASPVPEVGKELEGLVDVYKDATADLGANWTDTADMVVKATDSSMSDVTSKSKESLNTLTGSIVRPAMDRTGNLVSSGMKSVENTSAKGWKSVNSDVRNNMSGIESTNSRGWASVNSTTESRTNSFISTVRGATRDSKRHWDSMISDMNRSTRGLVNTSYSKGIVGVLSQMSSLAGVGNPLRAVHLSTGGILPGYQPGIDTIPAVLSAGEAVLRPEVVRMLGPDIINAWNKSARNGEIQGFANGGVVDGAAWVRRHKDDPYKGFSEAFTAAMDDVVEPSLKSFASMSGGYGFRGADDIRSGYPGIREWLGKVDKAAESGGNASKVVSLLRQEHDRGISGRPNKYTNGISEAWCADFVSWIVDKARANKAYWNSPKGTPQNRWPAVRTWESVSSRAGDYRFGTSGIRPGDIVTYGGGGQHINVVEKLLGGGRFQTIGGNESDRIRRQVRTSARGYGRPRWGLSGSQMQSGPFKGLNVRAWPGSFIDEPATDDGGIDEFLAKGAIVNSPTRAVIGEAGREAVIPLTDRERAATLLEEIGLPHKAYHFEINAAPNVPTEESILKALSYADTIYG